MIVEEKRKEVRKKWRKGKKEFACIVWITCHNTTNNLAEWWRGNLNIYYIQSYIYIYIYVFKRTCNSLVIELITEWKRKNKINMWNHCLFNDYSSSYFPPFLPPLLKNCFFLLPYIPPLHSLLFMVYFAVFLQQFRVRLYFDPL